ncbi:hypothetical protein [Psychroserpens sp. Hel_I_66]|uniref:hypothetical protein n=1 Tax=Psychroserpens sp. Hel_I_66 TaxID=1250004 RepID=UPI000648D059|nr:hypothetical protein [Psychroserpens sp. Hel_I_66]
MKKSFLILIVILFYRCDYLECSSEKLSESDETFLLDLNRKYSNFEIYKDDCFPLGYYNVQNKNKTRIDTLTIKKILDITLEHKCVPNRIKVYGFENDFKFILYNVEDKHLILLPSDL